MISHIVFTVNFGLEAKKSIIHPRSDSSNKSTRFSLSSEKSYPNGAGMTPRQPSYVTKEVIMNDDVEKRVLMNKDGSMSVEMKVRFRLVNDETLQWSTEIKKLPASTNECSSLQEGDPHCLQGKVVYSEPESNAECEVEVACSPKCHQMNFIESYCQNCCNQSQGYDIWKNPLHKDDGTSGTRSSSDSAGSSNKIIHQKASVDNVYTVSRSSEEYTEHVVEKASCFQQTIEERDKRIEYCSLSRCCSGSEVSMSTTKCNIPSDTCKSNAGQICHHHDYAEFDHLSKVTKVAEHLISATRNSSIIQSFKKDEDDDYDDLSSSVSRASQWCSEQDKHVTCVHCHGSQQSQNLHSSFISAEVSSCSADPLKSKSGYTAPDVPQEGHADNDSTDSARSSLSKASSRSECCCCSQCREAITDLVESDRKGGLNKRVQNSMSDDSKVSNKSLTRTYSPRTVISDSGAQKACKEETKSGNRSVSATSTNTCFSFKSTVCPCCGGCGKLISTVPANMHDIPVQVAEEDGEVKSLGQRSSKSPGSDRSNKCRHCTLQRDPAISNILENFEPVQNNITDGEVRHARPQSALSDLSNHCTASKQSNNQPTCERSSVAEMISENTGIEDVEEGRAECAMSVKSTGSAKTNNDIPAITSGLENQTAEEIGNLHMAQKYITETETVMQAYDMDTNERVPSAMSTKTRSSKESDKSHNSNNLQHTAAASPPVSKIPITDTHHEKIHSGRSTIALCKNAKVSVKSVAGSEADLESVLNPTDMSARQESRQTTDDANCSAWNSLSAASPSPKMINVVQTSSTPKSPIAVENNNQSLSIKSGHSKASSKSTRSNKHHCSSSRCVQREANSPSGQNKSTKSPTPAAHNLIDVPLSPTSTASVSLGLGAEERSEDLSERSMSTTSQITDEPRCLSEKYTFEPSVLDRAINNSAIAETREKVKTAVSTSSTVSEKSKLSNFVEDSCKNPEVVLGAESESIVSTKSKTESKEEVQLLQNDGDHRLPPASSVSSEKSQQNSTRKNTQSIKMYKHGTQAINKNIDKGETNKASTVSGSSSKSSQIKMISGKTTTPRAATSTDQYSTKSKEKSSSNLEIKEARKTDSNSATSVISLKTSKLDKKPPLEHKYVTKSEASQNCTSPDSKAESVLSHSPELFREKDTDAKSDGRRSRSNTSGKNYILEEMQHIDSNCKNTSGFKQRKISTTSQNETENRDKEPLMPSCLPNASPTDVINDWLKNIPNNDPMYEMEDEFSEQHDETLLPIPAVKEEGYFQNEIGEQSEKPMKMKESQEICGPEGADPVTEDINTAFDAKLPCNETFQTIAANRDCSHPSLKLTKRGSLTNNCQSSIQVMKVLLSPKLDRCNSLPEVSPTYGRRLSTSAKGLLDCLASLQLIDPDPKIYDKYSEIISTLQSLWINRPYETVQNEQKTKFHSVEDEFNPRSSSGIDLSSGSIGSGKGSISGGLEKSETAQGRTTLIVEQKAFPQIQGDAIMRGGCDSLSATPENLNTSLVNSDPITPDIAERVRCSPEHEQFGKEAQKIEGHKATDAVFQTNEHIKDIKDIALTFSTRTSQNNGNPPETNPPENNDSRTPSNQKGQLTKKISQDPDPLWVLSLLKKLEKQFMSHYANAIAEFKVRWDLNDNETLDVMISELKEEVHKRIQSTINRELQKIQSRAGRTPRPPISMLSRDSTVQTEQRRRRLKVMQNKLINASRSEDINVASGTKFSDQRSEDEYCPCDTCMKKKMTSRVSQCDKTLSVAPVLKDFDLRKILQKKKEPPGTMPVQSKLHEQKYWIEGTDSTNVQDKNHLEVANEEAKVYTTSQIGEDDILMTEEAKHKIITEHGIQACKNQDEDGGVINDEGSRTVNEGPSDYKDDGQPAEENMFDNVDGESNTEREIHETGEDLEDNSTEKKDKEVMNRENEEAEEETEGDTTAGEEVAMEKDPPDEGAAERKEIESSDIEEGEENPVGERESNERAEEEVSEGETNKGRESGDAEEEETDGIEEKAEIPEEGMETENRTGEETQSAKEDKTSRDESEEAENSNATSDERAQDNAPAAADEAKPRKNEIAKMTEGEKTTQGGTPRKSDAKMSIVNSADENQSESTEAENEVGKESHESKGETYIQKPTKKKDSISVMGQLVSEEEDCNQADMDDYGTDGKHQTGMRAESIENQAEGLDHPSQICGENSDCKLITQITKTSVESQTGSLEYSKDLTMKEKLQDIQSFMESLTDQDL